MPRRSRARCRWALLMLVVAAVTASAMLPTAAWALFSTRHHATPTYQTATLHPPSDLEAARCHGNAKVTLTWAASPSSFVATYRVYGQRAGGPATLLGTASAGQDHIRATGLVKKAAYTVWVVAAYRSWTSRPSGTLHVQC